MSEKRQWTMPQLIVLGRGTPEERVLAACKTHTLTQSGGISESYCQTTITRPNGGANCGACQAMGLGGELS